MSRPENHPSKKPVRWLGGYAIAAFVVAAIIVTLTVMHMGH